MFGFLMEAKLTSYTLVKLFSQQPALIGVDYTMFYTLSYIEIPIIAFLIIYLFKLTSIKNIIQ